MRSGSFNRNRPFNKIGKANIKRSTFDLSHFKLFTADMGWLIPILALDCIPGDHFNITSNFLVRLQPLVSPILHEINIYTHYFFVPYRLLDDHWEDFINKGTTGDYEGTLPKWFDTDHPYTSAETAKYSIWDYMGFPINTQVAGKTVPIAYPKMAYNFIYNEYYRDSNYIEPVDLMQPNILHCAWEKDYFTAAQPEQQRGTSPSFEVGGFNPIIASPTNPPTFGGVGNGTNIQNVYASTVSALSSNNLPPTLNGMTNVYPNVLRGTRSDNNNIVDVTAGSPAQVNRYLYSANETTQLFNINDLRMAVQLQMWMERNQRAGTRYTEFLQAHYGVSPRDDRLDRPEYIGGNKTPIVISEVLQTSDSGVLDTQGNSSSASPQGNLAGHGISANTTKGGKYFVLEFGCIIGLMSIRPRTVYQQGIDRQFIKNTPFDFVSPEFVHLSEQGIYTSEIYATNSQTNNDTILGFVPRYEEYRYCKNLVASDMRDMFAYWHLGRQFSQRPSLNQDFIDMRPSKRVFAVQNEPGFVINFGNVIYATRPLPFMGEPGRLDHS